MIHAIKVSLVIYCVVDMEAVWLERVAVIKAGKEYSVSL